MTTHHKTFRTYADQVELLVSRGLETEDKEQAAEQLRLLNYYRLSAYWYPMRQFTGNQAQDSFIAGASFDLAVELYRFDERLRHAIFRELTGIELAIRALLGYELGRIDPLIHESLDQRSAVAAQKVHRDGTYTHFERWKKKFDAAVATSREDFVEHHKQKYGGSLPIWAAVEVMDWGTLSHLYKLSPNRARKAVAEQVRLSAPQLESWLRALNVLRNYTAHHARIFNRVFNVMPKTGGGDQMSILGSTKSRVFGQATMIQYLVRELDISEAKLLPAVMSTYPHNKIVPFSRTGAPDHWQSLSLWA